MTSIRDVQVGSDVALMDKLGRFDRDVIVYGVAFRRCGTTKYLVSSRAQQIYRLVSLGQSEGIYPTLVTERMESCTMLAGMESDITWQVKVALAKVLQERYRPAFWKVMDVLGTMEATDQALPFFEQWQEQLLGCFEREQLDLFAGFLNMARTQKTIKPESFDHFTRWLEHINHQLADDVISKKTFSRTFSGFAHRVPGEEWRYFYDGQPQTVWSRQAACVARGEWVSPILRKTYWFEAVTPVRFVAECFAMKLQTLLSDGLLEHASALWTLPPALAPERLYDLLRQNSFIFNCQEKDTLRAYAYCYRTINPDVLSIIGAD